MPKGSYGSPPGLSSRGRRVCVLFPHLVLGGGETAMMEVAAGLGAFFEVIVAALDRRPMTVEPSAREELLARFGDVTFPTDGEELAAAVAGADAVLWYGLNDLTPRTLAGMVPRPASVRAIHTDKVQELEHHRRWSHAIDAVACVSPAVARRLPGAVFVPNAASAERVAGEAIDAFPCGPRQTLGFLGRLFSFKNVDWLVENLERVGCNLLIQGLDTPELTRADLEALARERGVADRVRFLPPGPTVGTLLRSVDALAVLSSQEGFPMVVVEAGLAGTPVIATPVGALPEAFADEVLFVPLDEGGRPRAEDVAAALARADAGWGR
ncbi:MAG TPA: glycosyltransferase family 4 protein, partial [Thermoanaerobaculia bacterium]|nr:glycosyltransferase family 4 protein [Thermoanaerobaculia bacterium]